MAIHSKIFALRAFHTPATGANVPPTEIAWDTDVAELILVRHGQANSHATDEDSYDRLSPLGRQQAGWLGAHMDATGAHFDQVISGTLNRQINTAREMGHSPTRRDARLNEMNYFAIARALETQHGIPAPADPAAYAAHLPVLMRHWADGQLSDIPENFDAFANRTREIIDDACNHGGRSLIVTSGGVIGMIVRHILALENGSLAKVMLQVMNSSCTKVTFTHGQLFLATFNATPHLDTPDRAHARTYV